MSIAAEAASSQGSKLLACARALVPVLRERADEAEKLRRIPPETINDLRRSGLLRTLNLTRIIHRLGPVLSNRVVVGGILFVLSLFRWIARAVKVAGQSWHRGRAKD